MLKNKWFIAAVVVLLTGAVAYDIWYFFLREEEPAGQVAGSTVDGASRGGRGAGGGEAPADGAPGTERADSAARSGVAPLVEGAAEGRPGLRRPELIDQIRRSREGRGWGSEPLVRRGALADEPDPEPEPPTPEAEPPDWELSAVMVGRDRRAAVVDGRVVREGDGVRGDGEVVEIRRNSVVIVWRGRRFTVQLPLPD